jgi:crotonobetainyl-CoA:carnitine CoA-transferase CaiB-like acyl-CoA transferase
VEENNEGILAGIKVLDFGRYIAGPFCGAILGDY